MQKIPSVLRTLSLSSMMTPNEADGGVPGCDLQVVYLDLPSRSMGTRDLDQFKVGKPKVITWGQGRSCHTR